MRSYAGGVNAQRLYVNAKERWVAAGYPDYPPWVPLLFHGFTVVAAVAAIAQRAPTGHGLAAAGLVALALVPYGICELLNPRIIPWPAFSVFSLGAVGVLMWQYPVTLDFGVLVVAMVVGRFGALEAMRHSAVVCGLAIVGLVVLGTTRDFSGTAFAASVVLAGWDIGWIMQYQQRRIDDQRTKQQERLAKATLEERQRIAREVHDVVAHSLSVTLLHLTAARRDLEDGGDVAEVIGALKDAEHVGRQAMTDIRQTVGMLNNDQGSLNSTPELADVPALVQQFRTAGVDVEYHTAGDGSLLTPAERTGLFRIVQESLANIAKHEPRARASVTLDLSSDPGRLLVRNTMTHPTAMDVNGAGLRGMNERADSLGFSFVAGPERDVWEVLVELPNPHAAHCPLPKLRDLRRGLTSQPAPETSPERA